MHQRNHGTRRKTPLEPHHDIDKDTDQGIDHRQCALFSQFFANLWTHKLDTSHLHSRILLTQDTQGIFA